MRATQVSHPIRAAERGRTTAIGALATATTSLIAAVLAAGVVTGVVTTGCTANQCSATSAESPSAALECPGGTLCYRGQCVKACSAGQERVKECDSDNECQSPRAYCVDGFCSGCEAPTTCLPALNICEAVVDVDLPDAEPRPSLDDRGLPPAPLDGAVVGGGLVFPIDAGVIDTATDVSHLVYVDITRQIVARTGVESTKISVGALDVGSSTVPDDLRRATFQISYEGAATVLRAERTLDRVEAGDCSLIRYAVYRDIAGADVGRVLARSADGYPNALTSVVELSYKTVSGRYEITNPIPLPEPLLTFSTIDAKQYIAVTGPGKTDILESWPEGDEDTYRKFVVFPMEPDTTTRAWLASPVVLEADEPGDILLGWDRDVPGVYGSRWRVTARIRAEQHDIVCRQIEAAEGSTNRIRIPSTLVREMVVRENLKGRSVSIELERSDEVEQQTRPKPGFNVRMLHRVRHGFIGSITFQ
ncbi:MAG: hypothetical protein H6729_02920 [Deltaproteobacteria bacterium]|nr:hypothetical protein [Deltaproteobacteria bacterium]